MHAGPEELGGLCHKAAFTAWLLPPIGKGAGANRANRAA